eukprot:12465951-Heterocapsa_arctica.AAC.1
MGHEVQICGDYEQFCKPVIIIERYRKRKHDIIFDGWWSCKGCFAKGPYLNKRDCVNPTKKQDQYADDDDGHKHKITHTDVEIDKEIPNLQDDDDVKTGMFTNKQARKRAEEKQAEVNDNKRRNNIEAHQKKGTF